MNLSLAGKRILLIIAAMVFVPFAEAEGPTSCPRFEIAIVDNDGARAVPGVDGALVHVSSPPLLTTADFTSANVSRTEGQVVLNVGLSHAAGVRIQAFTRSHIGVRLAFILDGRALKVVKVLGPIRDDGILMGPFARVKADALAQLINERRGCPSRQDGRRLEREGGKE
ncbi:MAG: hypothetical protein GC190_20400 [Alphaproteobacteria bacterium]|nr:hypothetical protein [Alphaproteobacteria bacterium]